MLTNAMKSAISAGLTAPDKEHVAKFGGFNDFPPNWRPCNPSDFWGKFSHYGVGELTEYRQMGRLEVGGKPLVGATLFFYADGTGLAVHVNWTHAKNPNDGYTYSPQFYQFHFCDHEFETVASRMHYNESKCRKCGYVNIVDSSG